MGIVDIDLDIVVEDIVVFEDFDIVNIVETLYNFDFAYLHLEINFDLVVFDSFDLPDGNKSIAFTVTLQPTENMSDSDLQKLQSDVIASVEKKCDAIIRDK